MTKTSKTTKTKAAAAAPDEARAPADELNAPSHAEASSARAEAKSELRPTKIQAVVALLQRPDGARIEDIMTATGWQAHSVRGAMSGAIKKGLGLAIASDKIDGVRVYRIAEAPA